MEITRKLLLKIYLRIKELAYDGGYTAEQERLSICYSGPHDHALGMMDVVMKGQIGDIFIGWCHLCHRPLYKGEYAIDGAGCMVCAGGCKCD